jgi:ribosomal protein S2
MNNKGKIRYLKENLKKIERFSPSAGVVDRPYLDVKFSTVVSRGYLTLNIDQLLDNGFSFASSKRSWHLLMVKYVFGKRNKFYLFKVDGILFLFRKALKYLHNVSINYGMVYLINSDKYVEFSCNTYNALLDTRRYQYLPYYYVGSWTHGLFTNKEYALRWKDDLTSGLSTLKRLPDCVVVFGDSDEKKLHHILAESRALNVSVLGLIDINKSPLLFDYIIPINSGSTLHIQNSLNIIINIMLTAFIKQSYYFRKLLRDTECRKRKKVVMKSSALFLEGGWVKNKNKRGNMNIRNSRLKR